MTSESTGTPTEGTHDVNARIEHDVWPDFSEKGDLVSAICTVMSNLDRLPKSGHNPHQDYDYVQDEDVMDAIRPVMADAGLMAAANLVGEHCEKRKTKTKGGATKVKRYWHYWFDITLAHESGQAVSIRAKGVAYSNGDKHYNQALQAAKKYTMIELFKLSSGEETDTDAQDSGESSEGVQQPQKRTGGGGGSKTPPNKRSQQGGKQGAESKRAGLFAMVQDLAEQLADRRGVDTSQILEWYENKMGVNVSDVGVQGLQKIKRHLESYLADGDDSKKEPDESEAPPDVPGPGDVDPSTVPDRPTRQVLGMIDMTPDMDPEDALQWMNQAWSAESASDETRPKVQSRLEDGIEWAESEVEEKADTEPLEEGDDEEDPDEDNPPKSWMHNYLGAKKRCSQVNLKASGTHDELRTKILQNVEWDLISHEVVDGALVLLDEMGGEWDAPDDALGEHLRWTMDEYDETWQTVESALNQIADGDVQLHESGAIKLTKL